MGIYDSWISNQPIAHRGLFNDDIPENSLTAFKNAMKKKIAVEFDVTSLADGTIIVFHDGKLARMTGQDGFVSNLKYEDISKLTLTGSKEKIPTLDEVLSLIDGKIPIMLELKNYGKVGPFEKEVWKKLQNYNGEYAIISFNPYTLEWFKNNAPKIKRGQVASFFKNKEITGIKRFYLKRMRLNKKISEPNFIVYSADDMPNKYVRKYYGVIPVLTYTIRNSETEEKLKTYCDNFLFDNYMPSVFENNRNKKEAKTE